MQIPPTQKNSVPTEERLSIKELRSEANILGRARLKNSAATIQNVEELHALLGQVHDGINEIIGYPEVTDPVKRKQNSELARIYFTTSKNIFEHARQRIELLLQEDISLGEEYLKKFLTLAGEYYVKYKVLLLYVCGHIPEDHVSKSGSAFKESPEVLLKTRKFINNRQLRVEHMENARTDIHHIDKLSYLGSSMDPLLFTLERAFHTLLHRITDNDRRENVIQNFQYKVAFNKQSNFQIELTKIEKKLQQFNVEYAEVLMEHPSNMTVFANHQKSSQPFSHYLQGIKPHFRKLRNIYVLEMTSRLLEAAPYFMRNISEAHHLEMARSMKLHLLDTHSLVLEGMEKDLPEGIIEQLAGLHKALSENMRKLDRIKEYKPFKISPTKPFHREFRPTTKDVECFDKLSNAIEPAVIYLEQRTENKTGKHMLYMKALIRLLNITLLDIQNCKETSQIGTEYRNTQKEYLRKEHLSKQNHQQMNPRRPRKKAQRESKRRWS